MVTFCYRKLLWAFSFTVLIEILGDVRAGEEVVANATDEMKEGMVIK